MFEPRIVFCAPQHIWTRDQFWSMAEKIAHDILISMDGAGHPLPKAMKHGVIDVQAAAKSILQSVVANINAEVIPAGNA